LIVLDSTHPVAVRAVRERIDPTRTLFIISSKSGTTTETLSFFKYFWQEVAGAVAEPGRHFVAVTDPGTPLETLAGERQFRQVFSAPTDVGGRYSALSVFGLVPAAVTGLDVHPVLDGAWAMMENTAAEVPVADNPALALGAAIGELALAGRDKLTLVASHSLKALPSWIEQLIAESTGKDGKGVVPVVDEPLGAADVYGDDRFFVYLSTQAESVQYEEALGRLELAGHPVARVQIKEAILIGQEFFRWEIATAAAGSVLGIHPFNQPDVQLAKDLARRKMADTKDRAATGWDDGIDTIYLDNGHAAGALEKWLGGASAGDYVAIQAYLPPGDETTAALARLRVALRDRTRLATTLGYGPRFLHSTGQLHKGGANTGLFLQIVDDGAQGMEVPETDYTFGDLLRAQAMGDAEALKERGRRVLRLSVGAKGAAALGELLATRQG
jgi:transaldolase/glucose-6-phosphate isomerase